MEKRATLTGADQWVEFVPRKNDPVLGPSYFDVSIFDVSDSKISIQRRFSEDEDYRPVGDKYEADHEGNGLAASGGQYRVGIAAGDYGTDTPTIVVRQ